MPLLARLVCFCGLCIVAAAPPPVRAAAVETADWTAPFPAREPPPRVAASLVFADATVPFAAWDARVRKPYATQAERRYRARVYERNVATILAHNRGAASWTMGVNTFSDLTEQEFADLMLRPLPPVATTAGGSPTEIYLPVDRAANQSIDWRTKGAVTPVKNQRHCVTSKRRSVARGHKLLTRALRQARV